LKNKNFFIFKNIERQDFLTLVSNSEALIGNSSSGILESPSLKIGVVNIGDRQNFREKNKNILDAKYDEKDIYSKIKKAIKIKNSIKNLKNIHGDGKSSKKIYKILKKIKITQNLLTKNTTY
jgi:GDP/UDP-N,N'-diacetylbacillosamine 2-epimerase (hydrolysing)